MTVFSILKSFKNLFLFFRFYILKILCILFLFSLVSLLKPALNDKFYELTYGFKRVENLSQAKKFPDRPEGLIRKISPLPSLSSIGCYQ
jgi:hypothetical protein